MAVNPYAPTEGEARALVHIGVPRLTRLLEKAEADVKRASDVAFAADGSRRKRAAARSRLTTACESRDRFQRALELAREKERS